MRGVLGLAVELWTFESPGGLQILTFSKCWASPPHLAKVGLRHATQLLLMMFHLFLDLLTSTNRWKYIVVYQTWQPKIPFWEFFSVLWNEKNGQNHKNIEIMQLTSFARSKLIMPYFQHLKTSWLNIGHEKHPFGYGWILKFYGLLLHTINNCKVHQILQSLQTFKF
jgi:hypothetical protein